jgi:protocatechuate 3,4-dioxygenase, beta subunit
MTTPADPAAKPFMRYRTPDQVLGPFFPLRRKHAESCDLTVIDGAGGIAQGEIIEVTGRILNCNGDPVSGAPLTIWQANTFGRYIHPGDTNPAALDPNFIGSADMRSGEDGVYRIKTVKPGAYPVGSNWMRPPHIHFEVHGRFERLITQMYFPDEPLNSCDRLLNSVPRPDLLIATHIQQLDRAAHRLMNFDIVLSRG